MNNLNDAHEVDEVTKIALGLAPRVRDVLNHLLGGLAAKEVANKMGLSTHTVHEYIKLIYASFGVCSRGELMSKFIPDRPKPIRRQRERQEREGQCDESAETAIPKRGRASARFLVAGLVVKVAVRWSAG